MSFLWADIETALAAFKNKVSVALLLPLLSPKISDENGIGAQLPIVGCDDGKGLGVALAGVNDCSVEAMATCVF